MKLRNKLGKVFFALLTFLLVVFGQPAIASTRVVTVPMQQAPACFMENIVTADCMRETSVSGVLRFSLQHDGNGDYIQGGRHTVELFTIGIASPDETVCSVHEEEGVTRETCSHTSAPGPRNGQIILPQNGGMVGMGHFVRAGNGVEGFTLYEVTQFTRNSDSPDRLEDASMAHSRLGRTTTACFGIDTFPRIRSRISSIQERSGVVVAVFRYVR
jgi:hypothetical protein